MLIEVFQFLYVFLVDVGQAPWMGKTAIPTCLIMMMKVGKLVDGTSFDIINASGCPTKDTAWKFIFGPVIAHEIIHMQ